MRYSDMLLHSRAFMERRFKTAAALTRNGCEATAGLSKRRSLIRAEGPLDKFEGSLPLVFSCRAASLAHSRRPSAASELTFDIGHRSGKLGRARAVAQLGRALRSGRRGRGFKSHQPDF